MVREFVFCEWVVSPLGKLVREVVVVAAATVFCRPVAATIKDKQIEVYPYETSTRPIEDNDGDNDTYQFSHIGYHQSSQCPIALLTDLFGDIALLELRAIENFCCRL